MVTKTPIGLIAAGLAAASLAACTAQSGPSTPGIGPAGGALAGDPAAATLIGAPPGAQLDDADRRQAAQAQYQALEQPSSGKAVAWRSAANASHYGSVVAGPFYDQAGLKCRPFTHTVYIDGAPQTSRGAACRGPGGNWQAAPTA